jgi:hypothetical protein
MISTTMKKKLLCAVSALAFLTAATAAGTRFVEHRITAAAAEAGVQIGKVNANLLTGRIALMDVTAPMGAARLHVGAVAIHAGPALIGPALAAENVTLNDVSVDAGFASYRIPRIDVTASTLNQQQLLGLFDKNATEPLAKRLAGFSASAISAPQMYIEQTVQGAKSTVVYKDIAARDIVNGKVGSFTVAAAAMSGLAADKPLDGTFGPMSVKDFDMVLMLRLYTDKAGPNDTVPRVIYSNFSAEKIAMTGDKGVKIGIDRISGGGFKARPGQTPWLEIMHTLAEKSDFEKLPSAEKARVGGVFVDMFESFEFGQIELAGLSIEDPSSNAKPVTVRIKRIAVAGGDAAETRLEGLDVSAPDGKATIGLMSLSGYSFKPTVAGLRELLARPDLDNLDDFDFRKLIPVIGTMRWGDFIADIPNEKKPGERIQMSIKGTEIIADKPFNGIPTNVRYAITNLAMTIPPGSQEEGMKDLLEMGYKSINVSLAIETTWNEPTNEIAIKEVSVNGNDMGSVVIRGIIGNITKDVFSSDLAMAQVALMGATAKSLAINIENRGGFERAIAHAAKKQGRTADDLRKEMGAAAAMMIPAVLGDSGASKAIATAVARFVTKPGTLAITATTKDKGGLGLADFMATGGDPTALMSKIDVTATAQ